MRNVTSLLVSGVVLSSSVVLSCRQALSFEPGTMGGEGDERGAPIDPPSPTAGSWTTPAAASCGEVLVGGVGEAEVAFTAPRGASIRGFVEGADSTVTLEKLNCAQLDRVQECVARLRCSPMGRGDMSADLVLTDGTSRRRVRTTVLGFDIVRLNLTGDGAGIVTSDNGQRCSGPCELRFRGATLRLKAEALGEATFTGFSGLCSSKTECVLHVGGRDGVVAEFRQPGMRELALLNAGGTIDQLVVVNGRPTACVGDATALGVRQFEADGSVRWTTPIPHQESFQPYDCILAASDAGSMWVFAPMNSEPVDGIKHVAHRISPEGAILASHTAHEHSQFSLFAADALRDEAVATGYTTAYGTIQPYFRKLDPSGSLAWHRTIDDIEGYVPAVAVADDGSVYGAVIQNRAPIMSNAILTKVARSGEVLWRRTLDSGRDLWDTYEAVATLPDGVVVAGRTDAVLVNEKGGRGIVRKYSPDGELVWEYSFGDRTGINKPTSLVPTADRSVFLLALRGDIVEVRKLDAAGHEIWRREGLPAANQRAVVIGSAADAQGNLLLLVPPPKGGVNARLWTFFQ